jgi:hypothetical protein
MDGWDGAGSVCKCVMSPSSTYVTLKGILQPKLHLKGEVALTASRLRDAVQPTDHRVAAISAHAPSCVHTLAAA